MQRFGAGCLVGSFLERIGPGGLLVFFSLESTSELSVAETRILRGFTVEVEEEILASDPKLAAEALDVLDARLLDIERALPFEALAALRRVPFFLGKEDALHPCACYHVSREWLVEHGYPARKAGSVDIANAGNFLSWTKTQPSLVLHELAHAYYHQVLECEDAGLRAAFEKAKASGTYEEVLHFDGEEVRHYAMTNENEYFAELTEAYYGVNDFYPFVRAELRRHDPDGFEAVATAWRRLDPVPSEGVTTTPSRDGGR